MDVGKRIRLIRNFRGLSKEDVAHELDMPVTTIDEWENNSNCDKLYKSHIKKMMKLFQCDGNFLVGFSENDFVDPEVEKYVHFVEQYYNTDEESYKLLYKINQLSPENQNKVSDYIDSLT